jgi:DNA-directed RNA polymerase subunit RPC12/RpoP
MDDTFKCDDCGREFPRSQLKEAFRKEGDAEVRETLCPNCLDRRMNEASEVYGVPGDEKRRAAFLDEGEGGVPHEETTGRRE